MKRMHLKNCRGTWGFKVLLPLTLILLSTLGTALASGGGEVEFDPILSMSMFWRVINFVILFAVLYKFLAKPARDFFTNRRQEILASLEEAKQSKEDAESKYKELSQRLANRDQEFESIRKTAIESAEKTKEKIIAEAHEKAKRMEEKVKETIDQEMEKARENLKREAAELALKLSEEKLVKEISSSDHKRFMDEYITGMK